MKIITTQYRVFQLKYLTLSHQKMPHLQVIPVKTNDKFCKAIAFMLLCIYSCFQLKPKRESRRSAPTLSSRLLFVLIQVATAIYIGITSYFVYFLLY